MLLQKFAYSEFARPLFGGRVAMAWADPRAPMPRLIGDEVLAVEHVGMALARRFGAGALPPMPRWRSWAMLPALSCRAQGAPLSGHRG
jgi:hypothetical protein